MNKHDPDEHVVIPRCTDIVFTIIKGIRKLDCVKGPDHAVKKKEIYAAESRRQQVKFDGFDFEE